jgi:phosphate transport system substrate-binding protein
MRKASILFALATSLGSGGIVSAAGNPIVLQGSGATFPAPLYQRWFRAYSDAHPDVQVDYQAVGSGAGIQQFTQHLVDFGASDAAMTDEQMAAVPEGVVLLPMTAGTVVLTYNLPDGPKQLRLSRDAYVGMFLGTVTQWNDPKIAAANPGVKLPAEKVTVVTRSDGSGTTFVFTNHLAAVSPAWKSGPGVGTTVSWPVGVGGKGNPGVAALVKQTPGAIGYVEYAYAQQTGMPMAVLQNKAGSWVAADLESAKKSLAAVELPENLRAWLPDPDAPGAYPIVTYTWLLAYQKYADAKKLETLKRLVHYGLTEGQSFSAALGYVPLPPSVVAQVTKAVDRIK